MSVPYPTLPETIAILSEIWNTNAVIPGNEYVLERIHTYVKTQLPQSIKNYQTAHTERETRKQSLALIADEITETFLNKTKYFYSPHSELYFTYNNQVRYSLINEDEIHHRILAFTSSAPSAVGASASASAAPSAVGASASSAVCPNKSTNQSTNQSTNGATASAVGCASASTSATISTSISTIISTSIKYKIKNRIIKSIQSRDILSSIPESRTIQNVIGHIYPALFRTRDHAKYFLTILGDVLLKKTAPLIYFVPLIAKEFIKDLGGECYGLLGSTANSFNTAFKFKYYEHQYNDCRVVDIHVPIAAAAAAVASDTPSTFSRNTGLRLSHMPELKSAVIDLFCVSAHYSHRFGSADDFLRLHCKTSEVATHAWFLRDRTEQQIILEFVNYATEPASSNHEISMTNMLYLWKMYLSEFRLPSMFFAATLRSKLIECVCDTAGGMPAADVFPNRTSKYLPVVSQFRQFWSEYCFTDDREIELEIDELSTLFNEYSTAAAATVSDATLIGMLRHFYPDIIIEDDKYILNVGCKLWDKNSEINDYLEEFKQQCLVNNHSFPQPLYNAYEYYCVRCYSTAKRRIISKRYFEKYFMEEYANYLDENGMITIKWWIVDEETNTPKHDYHADDSDDDDEHTLS